MNGRRILEYSFANNKPYKMGVESLNGDPIISHNFVDGSVTKYYIEEDSFLDPIFPVFSVKEFDGKREVKYYYPSTKICDSLLGEGSGRGVDLSCYDLCSDVELWVGIGKYSESDYDLIFSVKNDEQLHNICDHYGVGFPLPKSESLDDQTNDWHCKSYENSCNVLMQWNESKFINDFKLGSIKFKNNKPIIMKMYKSNYKDNNHDNNK